MRRTGRAHASSRITSLGGAQRISSIFSLGYSSQGMHELAKNEKETIGVNMIGNRMG